MATLKSVIGLDVGGHTVKVVRLVRTRGRLEVALAEALRVPADVPDRGHVIRPWLNTLDLGKQEPCVVGIAGSSVMFQPFSLAPEDPRTYGQAVAIEMARFNEMASETMVYDYAPVTPAKGEKRLLLSMARPQALEQAMDLPRSADYEIIDLVPSPLAFVNAVSARIPPSPGPTVFVNVGHGATEVAVATSEGTLFARSFPTAGSAFTDAMASAKRLPHRHAEETKVAQGSLTTADEPLRKALLRVADLWISELDACLSVYRSSYPESGQQPVRMVLGGGGAELEGLAAYLRTRLPHEIIEVRSLPKEGPLKAPGTFSVALGLAMAGFGAGLTRVSLLPTSYREEILLRRQKKYWGGAGVAAALILAVSLVGGYRDILRQKRRLADQQRTLARCQKLADDIRVIEQANQQILTMVAPVDRIARNGPFVRDLMALLATAKGSRDFVTLIADPRTYAAFAPRPDQPAGPSLPQPSVLLPPRPADPREDKDAPPPTADFETFVVEGYTPRADLLTVKRLITTLNKAPFIARADLLSDDKIVEDPVRAAPWTNNPRLRRFVIEIRQAVPKHLVPAPKADKPPSE